MLKVAIFNAVARLDERRLSTWIARSYFDDSDTNNLRTKIRRFFSSRPELASLYAFLSEVILSAPMDKFDSIAQFLQERMDINLYGMSRDQAVEALYNGLVRRYIPLKSDKVSVRKSKAKALAVHIKDLCFMLAERTCKGIDLIKIIQED